MRKTEFIQKYLGRAEFPFCDANREAMHDDLCEVIDYYKKLEQYPVGIQELENNNAAPCCAYEDRIDGSRCWNCGDPPKKAPLPKDFVKLKYLHVPSKNQNSDFSL